MDNHFFSRPTAWIGSFVIFSLVIFWALSMQRIDLATWAIGPGRSGTRVAEFGISNGTVNLFIGESGFYRDSGLHYDSRVFNSDEERSTWLPAFLIFGNNGSGVNIEIAVWFLILACIVSWAFWIVWRRSQIYRIRIIAESGPRE